MTETRNKQIEKDGIELEIEVSGRCNECDEELVESDITPQLVCPDCNASYSAVYKIMDVNR